MSSVPNFGANIAFIEELYEKYRADPDSVDARWREFFQGSEFQEEEEATAVISGATAAALNTAPMTAPAVFTATAPELAPARPPAPHRVPEGAPRPTAVPAPEGNATPLRGAASKIVQNMEASLAVPTATSVRNIPVKVLEENRRIINNHLTLSGQAKASYTHIIAWAIVTSIADHPRMNAAFAMSDGTPSRIDRSGVNLGIAIDVERKDGSHSLLVPNIKRAQTMDFAQFLNAYNSIVRKARNNTLEIADFEATTISLTNPGTIGTVASVPRLMQTQGTIIATGQIDYPAEYSAADSSVMADLGISKVMTMTSTYDHRIIQGAESGAFTSSSSVPTTSTTTSTATFASHTSRCAGRATAGTSAPTAKTRWRGKRA
jgi:2-oxoglutarate dehydrogenase E1 component